MHLEANAVAGGAFLVRDAQRDAAARRRRLRGVAQQVAQRGIEHVENVAVNLRGLADDVEAHPLAQRTGCTQMATGISPLPSAYTSGRFGRYLQIGALSLPFLSSS